jgi:4-diphosphocytidyl-2-C-methyl-D-erythritol kinase
LKNLTYRPETGTFSGRFFEIWRLRHFFELCRVILYPNAKINLGLNVVRKRTDGYHDIDSVFFPVAWKDILEVIPASDKGFQFESSGLPIPGSTEQNLIYKAWKILNDRFKFGGVNVHLHKMIPMGAGIGGGSADGAFMLRLLNDLFALQLSNETLMELAASLGSDCPFFIENKIAFRFRKRRTA